MNPTDDGDGSGTANAVTDDAEENANGDEQGDDEKTESRDEAQEAETKEEVEVDAEEKKEEEEESEYEWITDEEAEADELADVLHGGGPVDDSRQKRAELDRLRKEEDDARLMEQRLKSLSSSLNEIVSRPLIVDLTQEVIGRRMRLREVGLRYHEIQNKLMQQQQEKSSRNDEEETKMEMGKALGMIRIPNSSLKNLGYDR